MIFLFTFRGDNREHLYRRHIAPEEVEGVTHQQLEKLKSKKKISPDQSEEDRWKEVYKILFPTERVPSPCTSFRDSNIRDLAP